VSAAREGWTVGKSAFNRVYTEEGLALRRKRPWRHTTAVHREQRRPAAARNDIWSMDSWRINWPTVGDSEHSR